MTICQTLYLTATQMKGNVTMAQSWRASAFLMMIHFRWLWTTWTTSSTNWLPSVCHQIYKLFLSRETNIFKTLYRLCFYSFDAKMFGMKNAPEMQGIWLIIYYLIATVIKSSTVLILHVRGKKKTKKPYSSPPEVIWSYIWTRIHHIQEKKNYMQLACQKTNSIIYFTKITDK